MQVLLIFWAFESSHLPSNGDNEVAGVLYVDNEGRLRSQEEVVHVNGEQATGKDVERT